MRLEDFYESHVSLTCKIRNLSKQNKNKSQFLERKLKFRLDVSYLRMLTLGVEATKHNFKKKKKNYKNEYLGGFSNCIRMLSTII